MSLKDDDIMGMSTALSSIFLAVKDATMSCFGLLSTRSTQDTHDLTITADPRRQNQQNIRSRLAEADKTIDNNSQLGSGGLQDNNGDLYGQKEAFPYQNQIIDQSEENSECKDMPETPPRPASQTLWREDRARRQRHEEQRWSLLSDLPIGQSTPRRM
ncbi:uncharacterized protein B0I36DRAFT_320083 [Microdochium trichocladiopsis]|uniref:Uncharacterized protein n=1 Tax=Microdochium trichocladiopsis TaxID=1682393 RepID=A0A9P8YAV3_9PEZI|nr:uncharacterized protein B0I36DRAFT_320083 [Microdochium trichocladiopsis]KAH7032812.1 hypothetical protein B0I36DRAFT_320083 [Microdochium trichocladiopsis]